MYPFKVGGHVGATSLEFFLGYVSLDPARRDGDLSANKTQLKVACRAGFRV